MEVIGTVVLIVFFVMMATGGIVGTSSSIKSHRAKNVGNTCLVIGGLGIVITLPFLIIGGLKAEGPQLGKDLQAHGFTVTPRSNEGLGEAFVVDPARGNCRITFVDSRKLGSTLVFVSADGPAISEPSELKKIRCDKSK